MMWFFVGVAVGVTAMIGVALRLEGDSDSRERQRLELLRRAADGLSRYGEFRHLVTAIKRELADEAGA